MLRRIIVFLLALLLVLLAARVVLEGSWLDAWPPRERVGNALLWVIGGLYPILTVAAVYGVIRQGSRPAKTIAWMLVIVVLPVVGIILYSFIGYNLRKEKLFSRKQARDLRIIDELVEQQPVAFEQTEHQELPV